MTIQTNTYRCIRVDAPRTHQNGPGATKPVRIEPSDAIRPLSNRWTALDGFLPPVFTSVELKGRAL